MDLNDKDIYEIREEFFKGKKLKKIPFDMEFEFDGKKILKKLKEGKTIKLVNFDFYLIKYEGKYHFVNFDDKELKEVRKIFN